MLSAFSSVPVWLNLTCLFVSFSVSVFYSLHLALNNSSLLPQHVVFFFSFCLIFSLVFFPLQIVHFTFSLLASLSVPFLCAFSPLPSLSPHFHLPPRTPPHPPPTSSSHACHLFFHFLTQHLALCMSISGLYLPLPMPASPPPGSHYLSPSLPLSCLCLCLDSFYSRTCPTHMCMCARVHPHSRTPARTLIHSFRGIASLGRSFSLPLETWQTCLLKEDLMSRQDLSRIVSLKHILGISVVRAANMMHNKWIYARFWCFCPRFKYYLH